MFVELYCSLRATFRKDARQTRARTNAAVEFLDQKQKVAKRLENLAKRLLDDANEVDRVNREPEFSGQLSLYPHTVDLPEQIRSHALRLQSAAAETANRWGHSFRNEPGQSLRLLTEYLKSTTGSERYDDLALLIQIGYLVLGKEKAVTAEDVSKAVARAKKRS
jgi:hypothetical protein